MKVGELEIRAGRIYGRESLDDTERAPPVGNQIEIGKGWFSDNQVNLLEVYKDVGLSGGNWRRPDFLRLLDEMKRGECIWVWSQSRIARDTEMFLWFIRQIKEKGVYLIMLDELIDMVNPDTRFGKTINAAVDEKNRLDVGKQVRKVYSHRLKKTREAQQKPELDNLKGQGVWGRSPIPQEIALEAIRLHNEQPNLTIRAITAMLPNYRLISKKNPTYRKPSIGWVAKILKDASVQQYPSNSVEKKTFEKEQLINSPINEQKEI